MAARPRDITIYVFLFRFVSFFFLQRASFPIHDPYPNPPNFPVQKSNPVKANRLDYTWVYKTETTVVLSFIRFVRLQASASRKIKQDKAMKSFAVSIIILPIWLYIYIWYIDTKLISELKYIPHVLHGIAYPTYYNIIRIWTTPQQTRYIDCMKNSSFLTNNSYE